MFWTKLLILALIGAAIGWFTNVLAIKLIFRPLQPIQIPILNITLQGLIPKRKSELAKSIGEIVESELISIEEIIDKFIENENKSEIIFSIKRKIKRIIEQKLPGIIPSAIKSMLMDYIDDVIDKEAEIALTELTEKIIHKATSNVSIAKIIEEKINNFEIDKLEHIILAIAQKELKHIEILGGVIGFVIGILQGLIILFI
ncbi:uncharacterized membrane protein YheB (UPF0754 family) [Anaerosolibacter carboniphilus]|uniref:Uncharacterized membrane protein YheB (UPF0754 family) n=1 Tax=Anaerosolibacter carboniphilus TaxID=1417629 RepID=A0A841L578_9FIRM|nr:DUF445 family protein [Anaerosolibacter carboniphilus]MBB6218262.1 uncharacterized membrane protein YheB (UPF0754 family) [Anaerosolibacter carboniphilus]